MPELIEMPKLSDTMTTGTLVRWLKKVGDAVRAGEMIAEVETDKATMEVESFEDGVMLKQYVKAGESVAIGEPICAVGEKGAKAPEVKKPAGKPKTEAKEKPKSEAEDGETKDGGPEDGKAENGGKDNGKAGDGSDEDGGAVVAKPDVPVKGTAGSAGTAEDGERIKASPLARRIAEEKGVDLRRLQGSGPDGRIIKADVLNAPPPVAATAEGTPETPAATPVASLENLEIKVSNMRAAIAKALVASKTESPHFYLQIEVDGGPLTALRKTLNDRLAGLPPEQGGLKLTVNDLILKAAVEAVRRVPAINRSWQGDKIVQFGEVHLAFGVAVEDGLLTPVIRGAEAKSLRQISREARELIAKSRNKKLKPGEMTGSTLTVTNLGMFGISDFYGIINPPNAAILSIGATVKMPVVDENDQIVIGSRMKVGLSGDHRVIDGAIGAQYLAALKEILETPAMMLI